MGTLGAYLMGLMAWTAFPSGMICCVVIYEGHSVNSPVMERELYPHFTNETTRLQEAKASSRNHTANKWNSARVPPATPKACAVSILF